MKNFRPNSYLTLSTTPCANSEGRVEVSLCSSKRMMMSATWPCCSEGLQRCERNRPRFFSYSSIRSASSSLCASSCEGVLGHVRSESLELVSSGVVELFALHSQFRVLDNEQEPHREDDENNTHHDVPRSPEKEEYQHGHHPESDERYRGSHAMRTEIR